MKKYLYFIGFIIFLIIINCLPVSAMNLCTRDDFDLHVRDKFNLGNNKNDILLTPCVDETEKVYDFADLLTDEEENLLFNSISDYISKTNYDIVVVTTLENNKNSEVEYADDFYDYNNFGYNKTRDGVVLLIDMDNRRVYISTTGYAIKMYDDDRIESIIDYGYDYLTNEDYYNSFNEMINGLNHYYSLGYPSNNKNMEINEDGKPIYVKYISYPLITILSGIITLVLALILYFKSRLKIKVSSTISYLKNKEDLVKNDNLVNTIVTHHLRSSDTSSGGGSSGGSSFHSSSSGSFHGGGGRSF